MILELDTVELVGKSLSTRCHNTSYILDWNVNRIGLNVVQISYTGIETRECPAIILK